MNQPEPPASPSRWSQLVSTPSGVPQKARFILVPFIVATFGVTLLPTLKGPLSSEYPPIEDRMQRRPLPAGACALDRVVSAGGCVPAAAGSSREEEVTIPSTIPQKGLAALAGTLTLPQGAPGPRPAVVLVAGSGPQDRRGLNPGDLATRFDPPFALLEALGRFFAGEGLVVLRYDKRGPRNYPALQAPGVLEKFSTTDFEQDARDALSFVAARPEVDPRAVVLVGHSEGGELSIHIADGHPTLAGVVLLGALLDDASGGPQLDRMARVRLRQLDPIGWLGHTVKASSWHRCVGKLTGSYDPAETCIDGKPQRLLKDMYDYSLLTRGHFQKIQAPVFAAQGSVDRNIDPTTIARMKADLPGGDAEFHYIAGLNHAMVDVMNLEKPVDLAGPLKTRLRAFLASTPRR